MHSDSDPTVLPFNAMYYLRWLSLWTFEGNEGGFFEMHDQTGELFLVREIDLESLPNAVLSLQIQVMSDRFGTRFLFLGSNTDTNSAEITVIEYQA